MGMKTLFISELNYCVELECFATEEGEIYISIEDSEDRIHYSMNTSLSVETAIKLVKHLKKEIGLIKQKQS